MTSSRHLFISGAILKPYDKATLLSKTEFNQDVAHTDPDILDSTRILMHIITSDPCQEYRRIQIQVKPKCCQPTRIPDQPLLPKRIRAPVALNRRAFMSHTVPFWVETQLKFYSIFPCNESISFPWAGQHSFRIPGLTHGL